MANDWLVERLEAKRRREEKDNSKTEERRRGAAYARVAFNALCLQVKNDIERYKRSTGDDIVQTSEAAGILAIHRDRFPAFHLELKPPCAQEPETANVIVIEGYLRENRETDREDLNGIIEVLGGAAPDQYTWHYRGKSYTESLPLSGAILGHVLDLLLQ